MRTNPNFGDIERKYSNRANARIAIVPVPFDKTSTWIKGADKGPEAIIEASANMELYDIETDSEVFRNGIFTDSPIETAGGPQDMVKAVRKRVTELINEDKFVIVIGGEHTVSIGAVRAWAEKVEGLTVLQLDAHADLREEYEGSEYNHACVMARIAECAEFVQVGIRSMDVSEKPKIDKHRIFLAEDIVKQDDWLEQVVKRLGKNVYITVDLDVFDTSIMPSTGTPEPGGLFWYDVINLLRKVIDNRNVVGFDVVELCPDKNNKAPDFLAAKLIYKLLSYKFRI